MSNIIEKPWGKEQIIEQNEFYVVKKLTMHKDHCCSLQYHKKKHETIVVLSGSLLIDVGPRSRILTSNDFIVNSLPFSGGFRFYLRNFTVLLLNEFI